MWHCCCCTACESYLCESAGCSYIDSDIKSAENSYKVGCHECHLVKDKSRLISLGEVCGYTLEIANDYSCYILIEYDRKSLEGVDIEVRAIYCALALISRSVGDINFVEL